MIAPEESQDCNSVARGWATIFFFVCLLYVVKAAENIVSKLVKEVEADGTWDMMVLGGLESDAQIKPNKSMKKALRRITASCQAANPRKSVI